MILDWDQEKSTKFLTEQDEQFKALLQQVGTLQGSEIT